jgi:hypothetical protein
VPVTAAPRTDKAAGAKQQSNSRKRKAADSAISAMAVIDTPSQKKQTTKSKRKEIAVAMQLDSNGQRPSSTTSKSSIQ